jgi:hypothetical protein
MHTFFTLKLLNFYFFLYSIMCEMLNSKSPHKIFYFLDDFEVTSMSLSSTYKSSQNLMTFGKWSTRAQNNRFYHFSTSNMVPK